VAASVEGERAAPLDLTFDELGRGTPAPPAPPTRVDSKVSPAKLLGVILRDEVQVGGVDYDGRCYRLEC
jgi:hypothetical protein